MDGWLTYREAAREVNRSVRALQRWHNRHGMPMRLDPDGRKRVHREVLFAYYRRALKAWPAHQWRMRRITGDTPTDTSS
ncbi:hypothetical protein Leucomu_13065 [Leucobacter muris]|uniref:DNA-binding protein n=1 Tax=Leucobacter muris TaxID=1935379 RepID=A0ABX5QI68_9MICO|nr:hypothetical protein Leucomu_13065 [Leucobacter muris]